MPNYTYRGITLGIPENDSEYKGYFEAAGEGRLVVKKCADCGLLRGEPGPACPWCTSINWEWQQVSGKGTIYSYQVVAHTVIPSFRDLTPFAIVLVELDEQRGQPEEFDGLRITGNLVDAEFNMEKERERWNRQAGGSSVPASARRVHAAAMEADRRAGSRVHVVARGAGGVVCDQVGCATEGDSWVALTF